MIMKFLNNRILQFELFSLYFWEIGSDLEWYINILRIGNRCLFSINYETSTMTYIDILFFRFEFSLHKFLKK